MTNANTNESLYRAARKETGVAGAVRHMMTEHGLSTDEAVRLSYAAEKSTGAKFAGQGYRASRDEY